MNRRTILAGLIGCLCFAVGLHTAAGSPVLIGGSPDGIIYDVDPATGLASNPRDTGLGRLLTGLAFSPEGVLYAHVGLGGGGQALYTLDLQTGAPTLLFDVRTTGLDIGFDPTASVLVGATNASSFSTTLFSMNPSTGEVSTLSVVPDQRGSVAIDSLGQLYLLNSFSSEGDLLLSIDKTTGAIVRQWVLGVDLGSAGTAFRTDSELLVVDGARPGSGVLATNKLYAFDTSVGILQEIGPTGLDNGLTTLYSRTGNSILGWTWNIAHCLEKEAKRGRSVVGHHSGVCATDRYIPSANSRRWGQWGRCGCNRDGAWPAADVGLS